MFWVRILFSLILNLKEEVKIIIIDYHNHFFDSLVAVQKMREAARDMQEEDERRKLLGLKE